MQIKPFATAFEKAICSGVKVPQAVSRVRSVAIPIVKFDCSAAKNTVKSFGSVAHTIARFAPIDKSVEPKFLKSLLKIEGETQLETANLIKDELLKKWAISIQNY